MLSLKAKTRELIGKRVKKLRKNGFIPACLYGPGTKSQNLTVDYKEFLKVYSQAGETSIIDLIIDDQKPIKVLIHDVQYHPVEDTIEHVDFYKFKAGEKITLSVPLKFIGQSPAVKELGGSFVSYIDEVEIKCLPENLLHEIEIDISGLKTFEDQITIADIPLPPGVEILHSPEEIVAKVEPPLTEEEIKEIEEVVSSEEAPEVKTIKEEEKETEEKEVKEETEESEKKE